MPDNKLVEPKEYLGKIARYLRSIRRLWEGDTVKTVETSMLIDEIARGLEALGNMSMTDGVTQLPTLRTFFDQPEEKDPRYSLIDPAGTAREEKTVYEVDEWLDGAIREVSSSREMAYVHFMLTHFRKPAWEKNAHRPFMQNLRLFVDYYGQTYRVVGASRFGDLWLSTNLIDAEPQPYYDRRVTFDLAKLTNWRPGATDVLDPDEPWQPMPYNPSRPKQSLKASAPKTSGRHYKHVGDVFPMQVDSDTFMVGVTTKPGLPDGICAPGTKLYVRTK